MSFWSTKDGLSCSRLRFRPTTSFRLPESPRELQAELPTLDEAIEKPHLHGLSSTAVETLRKILTALEDAGAFTDNGSIDSTFAGWRKSDANREATARRARQ